MLSPQTPVGARVWFTQWDHIVEAELVAIGAKDVAVRIDGEIVVKPAKAVFESARDAWLAIASSAEWWRERWLQIADVALSRAHECTGNALRQEAA